MLLDRTHHLADPSVRAEFKMFSWLMFSIGSLILVLMALFLLLTNLGGSHIKMRKNKARRI